MVIGDARHLEKYKLHLETLACYTESQGMDLITPSQDDLKECEFTPYNSHLRRHCVQVNLMNKYPSQVTEVYDLLHIK